MSGQWKKLAGLVLVAAIALASQWLIGPTPDADAGAARLVEAFQQQQSGVWVEAGGRVTRLLADDNDGSRHQRFIIALPGGHTVLVAHNIDLAERVPLASGDPISLRGEYEFNPRGGVLHWTHHDPGGRHEGGWIRHDGRTYR